MKKMKKKPDEARLVDLLHLKRRAGYVEQVHCRVCAMEIYRHVEPKLAADAALRLIRLHLELQHGIVTYKISRPRFK